MDSEVEYLINIFKDYKKEVFRHRYPKDLFGDLEGDSKEEKQSSLKKKFRRLMINYASDKYDRYKSEELSELAKDIQAKIIILKDAALERIENDTYDARVDPLNDNGYSAIIVGKRKYEIIDLFTRKDMFDIYRAEFENDNGSEQVWIKMTRSTDDNGLPFDNDTIQFNNDSILREAKTLKHFDSIKDPDFQKIRPKHFPFLLDSFKFRGGTGDKKDRRGMQAEVIKDFSGIDLISFREKWDGKVPLYHVCWIMERALSGLHHLNDNMVLHGNIHPAGMYIRELNHNVIIGDFSFSIIDYNSKRAKYVGATDGFTAPEIYRGVEPDQKTDVFSLGMCVLYLLGGKVEERELPSKFKMLSDQIVNVKATENIREFILALVKEDPRLRIDSAWEAYWKLKKLRLEAFGKPIFIPVV